jgi:outer membrane protein TolC
MPQADERKPFVLKSDPSEQTSAQMVKQRESTLDIGIEAAILLALSNNRSLRVELYNTEIRRTSETEEEAVFDPVLGAGAAYERQKGISRRSDDALREMDEQSLSGQVSMSRQFETGTILKAAISSTRSWADLYSDLYEARAGISITQAILRGAGRDVNLAALRQARILSQISEYEFRAFSEALVAEVEEAYWDYALASKQIEIFEKSLLLAEDQLREIVELIAVGRLAETETTAAQAEIAIQRQGLIEAKGTADKARLRLLRLLNPPGPGLWDREIRLSQEPRPPVGAGMAPVEEHVKVALRLRPELNQARLGIKRQDLEIIKTKNGLLPKMDFFLELGKTGYSDSFGRSFKRISDDYFDLSAGVTFEFPPDNRKAEASHKRALLTKEQAMEALQNLTQLVELDVRSGYIEVTRAREKIAAGEASRRLQEEKLRIETEKLRVGRSTAFLVSQAQRDLLSSRINEIRFAADYLKALVRLYLLEGSLLERRGIEAPGKEPVEQ